MTDTTIEAGRWYRRRSDGLVVRTVWGHDGAWLCEMVDGTTNAAMADILEPWVPRVGEWVRWPDAEDDDCRQPWLVERIDGPVTRLDLARFVGRDAAGEKCEHDAHEAPCRLEPCAPPAIEALPPPSPEHLAAWAALGALSAPTPPRRDDGTRCHRCGGPAYTGLGTGGPPECLAPRCEPRSELEPTVRERWLTRTEGVFAIPVPGGERVWWATGHGWTTMHPIREEAVARWKEIVHRKR